MNFPFKRDQFNSIGLLRSFPKCLAAEQKRNFVLCSAILARKLEWAKLWEEELFPLALYCDHNRLSDEDEFRIMPEGDWIDATLRARSCEITRVQITMAYRKKNAGSSTGDGYIASIERHALNEGIPVFLGGIKKGKDRRIISKPVVRYAAGDSAEWRSGLISAIRNKLNQRESDLLLVFADRLIFDLLNQNQRQVVLSAVRAAMEGAEAFSFQRLIVLDRDPHGYFEYDPIRGNFVTANSDSELCGPCPTAS